MIEPKPITKASFVLAACEQLHAYTQVGWVLEEWKRLHAIDVQNDEVNEDPKAES